MTLLRLTPTGPIWPYNDTRLRADEPGTLFPPVLTAEDREPFGVIEPQPTDPLDYDPATHRVEETHPALVDGAWLQQWQLVELTPEEQAAYQQANRPAPDWYGFKDTLLTGDLLSTEVRDSVIAIAETYNIPIDPIV